MFVVMTVGASEAEILGVKSQILAEGMTPFDHTRDGRTVIAVVGRDRLAQAGPHRALRSPARASPRSRRSAGRSS